MERVRSIGRRSFGCGLLVVGLLVVGLLVAPTATTGDQKTGDKTSLWKGVVILYGMAMRFVVGAFFGNLVKQVNGLKDQLWMVNLRMELQGQRVQELLAELRQKQKDNKPLWKQVEYLTNRLQAERNDAAEEGELRRKEAARCLTEERLRMGARHRRLREDLFKDIKLFQVKSRDNQKRLEEDLAAKAAQLDASKERGRRLQEILTRKRASGDGGKMTPVGKLQSLTSL